MIPFYVIILILIALFLYYFFSDLRHRYFAFLMNLLTDKKDPKYEELKKDLFKPLQSQVSADSNLRKKKSLRILEIGVGTGVNFDYYPDGTQLVVVDPNPHFASYYNENRSKFKKIQSEEILVCTGEEMDTIESNSVDAVVMTLVMCSVTDIPKLLRQVKRVLMPGGTFYYMEHILEFSDDHWMRRAFQNFLSKSRIWPFAFDGCYLNRDMLAEIKATGFSKVGGKRFHAPKFGIFTLIAPHLMGTATK